MLETLLENMPDYFYVKDVNGRFVLASNRFCNLFGRSLDEILGKSDGELFPPEVAEQTGKDDLHVIRTGTPIICKEEGSDELGWVLTTKVPWRDHDGNVIGLVGISRDVTERKQEEKARRKADERYRQLVENSPTVTWLTDATGCTTFISSNVEQVYGYGPGEIRDGGEALWFGRIHPEDRDLVRAAFEALFARNTPYEVQYRIQRKDGRWIWLHDRANAVRQEEGQLVACGAFTDITDQKRGDAERQELQARLHQIQRLESLGVLASGLAHDFNNLLLAIYGNIDLALCDLEPTSEVRRHLHEAEAAVERAGDLVAQMLAYAGKGSRRIEVIDLNALVREMAGLLKTPISEKTTVRYELAEGVLVTRADPTQIRQIVMNLITNAAQAIGDEGGEIGLKTALVHCDRALLGEIRPDVELLEGAYVRVQVCDTGPGMDAQTQERIFDPFYTTKVAGTGLGLSAVHGIVRSHAGAIRVQSEVGRGCTFTLWFPAAPRETAAEEPRDRGDAAEP